MCHIIRKLILYPYKIIKGPPRDYLKIGKSKGHVYRLQHFEKNNTDQLYFALK